ncbi:MAG: hypothetical protein PHR28_10140 [candidate division Zixibacteria bacterium]|nr:hypothetical protein [candidate division Zixibacteria bacterium]
MLYRMCCIAAVVVSLAVPVFGQDDPGAPDTVSIVSAETVPGQNVALAVNMYNDELLGAITIPLHWSSPDITLDSVSFVGSRIAYLGNKPVTIYNASQNVVFGGIVIMEEYIPAGSGLIATLYFNVPTGTPDQNVTIDSVSIPPAAYLVLTQTNSADILPQMVPGKIKIGNPVEPSHITLSPTTMFFEGKVGFPDPAAQNLNITNTGGGTMVWSTSHSQSWLTVSPPNGTAPSITSIRAASSGLPVGTYYDTIVVSSSGADNSPQVVPVTLHVITMPPTIRFSPSQIAVSAVQGGSNPADRKLAIWTDVPGSILSWTVSHSSTWLTLSPMAGAPPDSVTLQFDITGLPFGAYADTIVISDPTATNNPQKVPVSLQVVSNLPVLKLDPHVLYVVVPYGTNAAPKTFQVLNDGEGALTYEATEHTYLITSMTPSTGTAPQEVTLEFYTENLGLGEYIDTVTVTSPEALNSPQKLIVDFNVTNSPATIALFPTSVSFNYYECWQGPNAFPPTKTFQVINTGNDPMLWYLTHTADWLVISDTSGVDKSSITLSLNADGMPVGTYYDTIVVSSQQAINSPRRLPVTLTVVPGSEQPVLKVKNTTVDIPVQEVFGVGLGELGVVAQVSNLNPGCMDFWTEDNIPWLRIIDSVGSAPSPIRVVLEVGSYTYGVYPDSFLVYSSTATNSPQQVKLNMLVWRYHGDPNWDNKINITDMVYIVSYLFRGGPLPRPTFITGDCNCNGFVDISDAVYIVNYLFRGGSAPCGNP